MFKEHPTYLDADGLPVVVGEFYTGPTNCPFYVEEITPEHIIADSPDKQGLEFSPIVFRLCKRIENPKRIAWRFRKKEGFIEGIITFARDN